MLIPNKFNGYQSDGRRLLFIGGGVGEAALIGAALGGGSAAITGGDPLKGALLGGLTGGAGAGLSGALAGGTGALAGTAGTAGLEAATAAGTAGTAGAAGSSGIAALAPEAAQNIVANPGLYPAGSLAPNMATSFSPTGTAAAIPSAGSNVVAGSAGAAPNTLQQALQDPLKYIKANPMTMGAAALAGATGARKKLEEPGEYSGVLSRFKYDPDRYRPMFAEGGIASLAEQPVERMSDRNQYETLMANGGQMFAAGGGISSLGTYSDGGRMLKGPGDGMSDSIPASISDKRPARLADGEFVVPADVVSHLGNGSTDAGARQLYNMMDKVRKARTGTKKQGRQIQPQNMMPA